MHFPPPLDLPRSPNLRGTGAPVELLPDGLSEAIAAQCVLPLEVEAGSLSLARFDGVRHPLAVRGLANGSLAPRDR